MDPASDPWADPAFAGAAPPPETTLASRCPACGEDDLRLRTVQHEVPHFGRALETLLRCPRCRFRTTDFMVLDQRAPLRVELRVTAPDHLWARVIRSNSGTWSVPEIGLRAEPSAASEAFITNVEGLLDRARDVLLTARDFQEAPERRALVERLLARCDAMIAGREPCTIVLEDPFGNSAIVHDDAERRALSEEEAAALEPGMVVLDKDELKGRLAGGEPEP